jgi:hypothetical protein
MSKSDSDSTTSSEEEDDEFEIQEANGVAELQAGDKEKQSAPPPLSPPLSSAPKQMATQKAAKRKLRKRSSIAKKPLSEDQKDQVQRSKQASEWGRRGAMARWAKVKKANAVPTEEPVPKKQTPAVVIPQTAVASTSLSSSIAGARALMDQMRTLEQQRDSYLIAIGKAVMEQQVQEK